MKGKLLTFHLLIFSDSPAQVKFLFTMGRHILNIRTLNSYRLLFGSICSFLCTEEWFIKTQVPYFWQLLLTHCFPDLGLRDRYFKMNITQVCIGEIGDWASIRVGLELDESSDRVSSSFSLVCHGGHSRGCGSSVRNICVTLLTDQ